jgi:hypothetical protein
MYEKCTFEMEELGVDLNQILRLTFYLILYEQKKKT